MRIASLKWLPGLAGLLLGCSGNIEGLEPAPPGASAGSAGASSPSSGGASGRASGGSGGTPAGAGGTGVNTGGHAGNAAGSSSVPAPNADGELPYAAPTPGPEALRARTWKLSHAEYARSVQAFLGVMPDTSLLTAELDNGVYPNMSGSGFVRVPLATDYYTLAETLTNGLSAAALAALVPGGALVASAKDTFLASALEKAFRRPARADEITEYGTLFELGAGSGDVALGFRAVLRALVTSPNFLYRTEIGSDSTAPSFTLTDHEVASLLSFSLLGEPPSSELYEKAGRGELTNVASLGAVVSELLASPRATQQLAAFATQWLKVHHFDSEVEKDEARFPDFAAIKQAMLDETTSFLGVNAGPTGTLGGLLTTPVPMPAGALGNFYRSEPSGGAGGVRTGVLALGTLLSARAKPTSSSPTLRGLFVRDRFLCQQIHLPEQQPPDIVETQIRQNPKTTRELYELHASQPACATCHLLLDSIGFNFEDLDAAGRFRTAENGVAIDTTGQLLNTDVNGPMANHTDLANALAESEWVRECVATQAFRFYFGVVEADRGIPPVQAARLAIGAGTFQDLVIAVMSSSSTFQRVRN
jgi:hypothetical protein